MELDITFRSDIIDEQVGYTDSNWTRLKDGQKSIGGYAFLHSGRLVSHQSKQQANVAFSLTEAEYIATIEARKKPLSITRFLAIFGYRLLD